MHRARKERDRAGATENDRHQRLHRLTAEEWERWAEEWKAAWDITIDLGSATGKNTREMALEAGLQTLYEVAFQAFSSAVHHQWDHVGRFNHMWCEHGGHAPHGRGSIGPIVPDLDWPFRGCKYWDRVANLADPSNEADSQTIWRRLCLNELGEDPAFDLRQTQNEMLAQIWSINEDGEAVLGLVEELYAEVDRQVERGDD